MADYEYARALIDSGGAWDIDNPHRVDGEGHKIHLATEIEDALPGRVFVVHCNGPVCCIEHVTELPPAEVATQDTVVADHKANV